MESKTKVLLKDQAKNDIKDSTIEELNELRETQRMSFYHSKRWLKIKY